MKMSVITTHYKSMVIRGQSTKLIIKASHVSKSKTVCKHSKFSLKIQFPRAQITLRVIFALLYIVGQTKCF